MFESRGYKAGLLLIREPHGKGFERRVNKLPPPAQHTMKFGRDAQSKSLITAKRVNAACAEDKYFEDCACCAAGESDDSPTGDEMTARL